MQLWEKPPPPPALPPPLTNIIIQLHPFCPPPPRSGGGRRSRAWNETNFIVSPADDDKETRAIRCLCSASISRRRFERRARLPIGDTRWLHINQLALSRFMQPIDICARLSFQSLFLLRTIQSFRSLIWNQSIYSKTCFFFMRCNCPVGSNQISLTKLMSLTYKILGVNLQMSK